MIPPDYRLPETLDALRDECDVTFFQGPGPGGQHRNRSRTAARLQHRPTGLTAVETRRRSQAQNLEVALARLRKRIEALMRPKPKRVATKPTRAARERRLEQKRLQSRQRRLRRRVASDE